MLMPFQLNHKTPKSKLRREPASPIDIHPHSLPASPGLVSQVTPNPTTDLPTTQNQKGFNMFWRKKSSSAGPSSERSGSISQNQPIEPPKPILRMNTEGQGVSNIRFAGSNHNNNNASPNQQSSSSSPIRPVFPMRASTSPAAYNSKSKHIEETSSANTARVRNQPPAPRVIVSSYDSYSPPTHPHQRMASYDSSPLSTQPKMMSSPRRSSRPTSPSTSSFGARSRARTEPIPTKYIPSNNSSPLSDNSPLETPPMPSSHVTTPPTAYVSSFQTRAPPPPSPYRPTNERRRSSLTRNLPEQLPMMNDFAPTASIGESLLASDSRSSVHTLPGPDVPMLNIIPATPQNQGEEFSAIWEQHYPSPTSTSDNTPRSTGLEEAVKIEEEEMISVPLESSEVTNIPSIDVQLDFSPFSPLAELPNTDTPLEEISDFIRPEDLDRLELQIEQEQYNQLESNEPEYDYEEEGEEEEEGHENVPSDPLPPSPPFMSYPSLPSLSSHDHESLRSSASECSMTTSSSMSSLVSFPDVEEALGSMLASLSDSSMASTAINTPTKGQSLNNVYDVNINPGLGLGLGLDLQPHDQSSTTAPLSPRRRAPPPPLDLTGTKYHNGRIEKDSVQSAPIINHRVAFYTTAKAHPNSPSSGIFTSSSSLASSASSSSTISLNQQQITPASASSSSSSYNKHDDDRSNNGHSYRDSISLASEASDEDLHTASIISLTPIMQGKKVGGILKELREEEIITEDDNEYQEEESSNVLDLSGLGLGLGLGLGSEIEMGFGRTSNEYQDNVEVGLAL